jgi:NAD(P)H-dependent flavin oxidoreductase YrpB (nitropropane dioxygenase family)
MRLGDSVLTLGREQYVPIVVGGMGVDVSTPALALEIARLGGIGHLSDALAPAAADRHHHTHFVHDKFEANRASLGLADKSAVTFDMEALAEATRLLVGKAMAAKRGLGAIFVNVMEKLTMTNPRETLRTRLRTALDAGIDGITLAAGLHLGSLDLMADHPRFREAKLGIIVSSARALSLFLRRAARVDRAPDYVIVEGPLAGGHLGFGPDWSAFDLHTIVDEVRALLTREGLTTPVIAAGGIFTGGEAAAMVESGASGVQVATRFAVTRESGLPDHVKQAFFHAEADDVVVNGISPTGYPMRMLRQSPAIGSDLRPSCESLGYRLDNAGRCSYLDAYAAANGGPVHDKTCLCAHMHGFRVWTCGHNVSRLKETTNRLADGSYQLPTAEQVFRDYQWSIGDEIALPTREAIRVAR